MALSATRVAFVAAGAAAKPESYVGLAESFKRLLDREVLPTPGGGPAFQTEVFTEVEPALTFLKDGSSKTKTLVLLSEQLGFRADEIAQNNPEVQVTVFTGAVRRRGEVVTVRKEWVDGASLKKFVS